jgi:hypothetical protein
MLRASVLEVDVSMATAWAAYFLRETHHESFIGAGTKLG